jgi:hypothetical protein
MKDIGNRTVAAVGLRQRGTQALRGAIVGALLLGASHAAMALEYQVTEEERAACTPDVFRLCSAAVPDVQRIIACMRRERSRLSPACRNVVNARSAGASRFAAETHGKRLHASDRHWARHHHAKSYRIGRSD